MFRSILVPIDGSSFSEHALPYALALGEALDAPVHVALVHVPDTFNNGSETMLPHSENLDFELKDKEQEYLTALQDRLHTASRASVSIRHLEGVVAETLEEEVVEKQIGLVVMSTHGRGYMSRAILGSVTDHLVRHLSVPILLVHPPQSPVDLKTKPAFRNILVPLNGTDLAEKILPPVATIAACGKGQMQLLRVVCPPQHLVGPFTHKTTNADHEMVEKRKLEAMAYVEKTAQQLRKQALAVQTKVVVNAHPASAILVEAQASASDLIAVATRGHSGLMRLLVGSVTDKILRTAAQPILVYHPS